MIGTLTTSPIMINTQLPLAAPAIASALSSPITASAMMMVPIAPQKVLADLT